MNKVLKQKRKVLIRQLRKAKTSEREDAIKMAIDFLEEEMAQCDCQYDELKKVWGTNKGITHSRSCPKYYE